MTTFFFLVVLEVFTSATLKISYVCMYVMYVKNNALAYSHWGTPVKALKWP